MRVPNSGSKKQEAAENHNLLARRDRRFNWKPSMSKTIPGPWSSPRQYGNSTSLASAQSTLLRAPSRSTFSDFQPNAYNTTGWQHPSTMSSPGLYQTALSSPTVSPLRDPVGSYYLAPHNDFGDVQAAQDWLDRVVQSPSLAQDLTVQFVRKNSGKHMIQIFKALIKLDYVMDRAGSQDVKRFKDMKYSHRELEAASWRILGLILDLHTNGRRHDHRSHAERRTRQSRARGDDDTKLTCQARVEEVCKVLEKYKSAADKAIRGENIWTFVCHPRKSLVSKETNRKGNDLKQHSLQFARENIKSGMTIKCVRDVQRGVAAEPGIPAPDSSQGAGAGPACNALYTIDAANTNEEGIHDFMPAMISVFEPSNFENTNNYQFPYTSDRTERDNPPWIRHLDRSETYGTMTTCQQPCSSFSPEISKCQSSYQSSVGKDNPSRYHNVVTSDMTPPLSQAPNKYGHHISHSHQRPDSLESSTEHSRHLYGSSQHDLDSVQRAFKPLQFMIKKQGSADIIRDVAGRLAEQPNRHDTRHINTSGAGKGNKLSQLLNGRVPYEAAHTSMSQRFDTMPIDPRLLDGITGTAHPSLLAFDTSASVLLTPPTTRQSSLKGTFSDFRYTSSPEVYDEMVDPSYTEEVANKRLHIKRGSF